MKFTLLFINCCVNTTNFRGWNFQGAAAICSPHFSSYNLVNFFNPRTKIPQREMTYLPLYLNKKWPKCPYWFLHTTHKLKTLHKISPHNHQLFSSLSPSIHSRHFWKKINTIVVFLLPLCIDPSSSSSSLISSLSSFFIISIWVET